MPSASSIDTRTAERRALQFSSIDEILKDVERILAAERAGTLRHTGNWTLGQILGHLAAWINYSWDGYPPEATPPWLIRVAIKLFRNRIINHAMTPGLRLGRTPGGTLGTEPYSTEEGARRYREALTRLKRGEAPRFHSPALGRLTEDERLALNCRHAELHLSFLHP